MPTDSRTHLRFRIEPKLLARLNKARDKSGRTLTAEITERLDQSLAAEDQHDLLAGMMREVRLMREELSGELKRLRSYMDDVRREQLELPDGEQK